MIRLNLLPPDLKADLYYSKKNARLYQFLIKLIAYFVFAVALMVIIGFIVYKNKELANEVKTMANAQTQVWKEAEDGAKDFAERLNLIEKIRKENIKWNIVFEEIAKSTPANVKLSSFDFTNNSKQRISFSGYALSNTDIGKFRELLSKSSIFEFVDIENISQANDPSDSSKKVLSFTMTMSLKQNEVRK